MPSLALRPCPEPGCGVLTQGGGRCQTHVRAMYQQRGGSACQRGYDRTWQKCRLIKLSQEPLCQECKRNERITLAQEVDHIVPIADGGDRLDLNNLQSMCKSCHSAKTMRESRQKMPAQ